MLEVQYKRLSQDCPPCTNKIKGYQKLAIGYQNMAKSDREVDLERGTASHGRGSSCTTDNLKTTRSLPIMGVTSSDSSCDYMSIELQNAAIKGDVEKFKVVLDQLSEKQELKMLSILETVSPIHNTLLHLASLHGSIEIVQLIVRRSPLTLKKTNLRGETALHTAAKAGKLDLVSSLIELEEDYASSDDKVENLFRMSNLDGNTALHEALIYGHESVAKVLIVADPDVSFYVNKEYNSPLCLAAQAGCLDCVKDMMESEAYKTFTWPCENTTANGEVTEKDGVVRQAKSPIRAAVVYASDNKNSALLNYMLEKESKFIDFRDKQGRSAFHVAASRGYLEGVKCFLKRYPQVAFQRDNDGLFPVHFAALGDHVDVVHELLPYCLHLSEMLNHNYQNILHSAAENGGSRVVSYVLKTKELEKLINQKDKDGYTPLHLAAINRDPFCAIRLARDRRVDKNSLNNQNWTALDACKYLNQQSFRKHLTLIILKRSGVKPSLTGKPIDEKADSSKKDNDKFKDISNALLVVSTLVATMTFAAGFTVPGGYNDYGDGRGMAIMLREVSFRAFLVCDTIAMYSSIFATVIFTWAQLGGENLVSFAYQLALPSLALALNMMSLAYIFGVYVVVSKLSWLAKLILGVGLCFQSTIALSFLLLVFSFITDWSLTVLLKISPLDSRANLSFE